MSRIPLNAAISVTSPYLASRQSCKRSNRHMQNCRKLQFLQWPAWPWPRVSPDTPSPPPPPHTQL